MISHINLNQLSVVIAIMGLLAGCATDPPPLPPGNPTDSQARESPVSLPSVPFADATTQAVTARLKQTSSESAMQGRQHDEMKMEGHEAMQHGASAQPDKKAVTDEMKKTADEMKKTSNAMKKKSDEIKTDKPVYTCPMHPEVIRNEPGKCPICGMTLVNEESSKRGGDQR
jgi:rubrerythrin